MSDVLAVKILGGSGGRVREGEREEGGREMCNNNKLKPSIMGKIAR